MCGSHDAATPREAIDSPPASRTPRAAPSSRTIDSTSAPVRIVAPASRAARSSAATSPDVPPATPAPAAHSRNSRLALLPGDRGPMKAPVSAGSSSAAFSMSVSNHSVSQSCAHMGGRRISSSIRSAPSRRTLSARRRRSQLPIVSMSIEIHRRLVQKARHHVPEPLDEGAVAGPGRGILRRHGGDRARRLAVVAVDQQSLARASQGQDRGAARRALKPERLDHLRAHERGVVQQPGAAIPRMELEPRSQTPDGVASLDDKHLPAAARQHRRRGQAVGPRADDDDIEGGAHSSPDPRSAFAASSPGAPMIPPPGCAPDDPSQRFLIGVR